MMDPAGKVSTGPSNGPAPRSSWRHILVHPFRLGQTVLSYASGYSLLSGSSDSVSRAKISVQEHTYGVWKLKVAKPSTSLRALFDTHEYSKAVYSTLPLLRRLAVDVFKVSPRLVSIYCVVLLWHGIESPLKMYLNNKLLRALEEAVVARSAGDGRAIIIALAARSFVTLLSSFASWYEDKIQRSLHTRITRHFRLISLQGDLDTDLAASKEYASQREPGREEQAWTAVRDITSFMTFLLRTVGEFAVIVDVSNSVGGPLFVLACLMHPLASQLFNKTNIHHECLAYTDNDDFHRLEGLNKLADVKYRQDIIANGVGGWITEQYRKASKRLGDVSSVGSGYELFHIPMHSRPYVPTSLSMLEELPIVFCAVNAIRNPAKFSVASLAILQQSARGLLTSTHIILYTSQKFLLSVAQLEKMYAPPVLISKMQDGIVAYPRDPKDGRLALGMGFELRNISFSYPGTQSENSAINNISFTINPGQLVVVVGANGSGKSTLVRLLSRLYDPSSGQVLIDGLPSSDYRVADLHRATALLSQDGMLYPLSLRENIGLGYIGSENDEELVTEAAKLGGAMEVVNKFKYGMETMLDPSIRCVPHNLRGKGKDHPLVAAMEALPKALDVSGGEKQRIIAARTFMRFNSGAVRFVAVDEPSSALDADAELRLFENLIAARKGKTMVFVTHRFGHLTRYADKIICMKDGVIVEEGTHDQLIGAGGEYANLYNIQAAAFAA